MKGRFHRNSSGGSLCGLFGSGMLGRKPISIPAVNIAENKDNYTVSIAARGLKKNDFEIDMEGNMLTVSCEKEETKEDKQGNRSSSGSRIKKKGVVDK